MSVLKGIGEFSADIQSHADFFINFERPGGRSERVGLTVPKGCRTDFELEAEETPALPAAGPEVPVLPSRPGDEENTEE